MPDLEISRLPVLSGASLQATDPLALADLSAGETKRITAKELIQHGIALIDDGSIPGTKVTLSVAPGSIGTVELGNDAVTALKLANNSTVLVTVTPPATGEFIGQLTMNPVTGKVFAWDGNTWQAPKAAGSINEVNGSPGVINVSAVTTGDTSVISAVASPATSGGQVLAGPTGSGGAVALRGLAGSDLPVATSATRGAVAVGGSGLRLAGDKVVIDNTVAPGTAPSLTTYNAQGLVTGGKVIESSDLPIAGALPGVVTAGTGLVVDVDGSLDHSNGIAPGSGAKVTYDNTGHITGTAVLAESDIPDLPASKVTSGTFDTARLADRSVTANKLADYALAFIQEAVPFAGVNAHPIGMTWLQESTGQVSVWNGNSWMKTGASTLFNRNLRYVGTYDPSAALVTGTTQFGVAEGFKAGDPIPAADDKIAGVYFVANSSGSSASLAGGVAFDPGDWLLCQGAAGGWVRIDTLSGAGGGGGGGATVLDDLLDVTLTNPSVGQTITLSGSGQWVNTQLSLPTTATITTLGLVQLADAAAITAGTAGRAVTADQLKTTNDAVAANTAKITTVQGNITTIQGQLTTVQGNITTIQGQITTIQGQTVDASETVKGIVELATAAETTTGTDATRAVHPAGLKVELDKCLKKNISTLPDLP